MIYMKITGLFDFKIGFEKKNILKFWFPEI